MTMSLQNDAVFFSKFKFLVCALCDLMASSLYVVSELAVIHFSIICLCLPMCLANQCEQQQVAVGIKRPP